MPVEEKKNRFGVSLWHSVVLENVFCCATHSTTKKRRKKKTQEVVVRGEGREHRQLVAISSQRCHIFLGFLIKPKTR